MIFARTAWPLHRINLVSDSRRKPLGSTQRHAEELDRAPQRPGVALEVRIDRIARATRAKGAVVTYLIVGLDRKTHARWHENVSADDITTAQRIAVARAAARGLDLVIAAVIGPNSAVMADPAENRTGRLTADAQGRVWAANGQRQQLRRVAGAAKRRPL